MNTTIPFTSPLATPEEIAAEKKVLNILASEVVQAAKLQAREIMANHAIAKTADGNNRIDYALDHWLTQLATQLVGMDLHTPSILWNATITRFRWFGHEFPGSAAGIDCPDNIYRTLALNGTTEYEIIGRVAANRPAQFSFQLTPHPGCDGFWTTADLKDISTLHMLTDSTMAFDDDGSFRIRIGAGDRGAQPNSMAMPEGINMLTIRDNLSNWQQVPNALVVRAVGGDPLPAQGIPEAELIARTAAGIGQNIAFWVRFIGNFHAQGLANVLPAPYGRNGAFGYASAAKFNLRDDQALVITVATGDARYMGMQVSDLWGIAPSPTAFISSYNENQAVKNTDGSITFVIAKSDPGLANWVHTAGWNQGWMFFRWQGVSDDLDTNSLILDQQLLDVGDLTSQLPRVSPDERMAELERRRREWHLRTSVAN